MMNIPEWLACSHKDDKAELMTALELFIYNNEPAGQNAGRFRTELQNVVDELMK